MVSEAERQLACRRITSLHNPVVKLVRALDRRKIRRESSLFVAEGLQVVATGRDRGWTPRFLLVREGTAGQTGTELSDWAVACGAVCLELSESVFTKVAARNNPQDLIAVFTQRWGTLPAAAGWSDLWLALENIRDPGNLGAIVRTADATGVNGIVLVGACCDPYTREAVRASMGSIFNVFLVRMEAEAFRCWRAAWPGEVVGTHLSAGKDFRRRYQTPVLLLMGSEGPGLSLTLAQTCTQLVKIPMIGYTNSLNLAIATALMLYEIRRGVLSV